MGLLPITGIPLPFVSYGGSSLLSNFIMIGLLLNISGRRDIEQALEVPTGTNTLRIYAQDINGQETSFTNTYTRESGIQLSIENQEDGNNILISASSQEQLSYLTYRWDEEDETRVDINDTQIDYELEPLKGTHKLTVIVVDINNNKNLKFVEIEQDGFLSELDSDIDKELIKQLIPLFYNNSIKDIGKML